MVLGPSQREGSLGAVHGPRSRRRVAVLDLGVVLGPVPRHGIRSYTWVWSRLLEGDEVILDLVIVQGAILNLGMLLGLGTVLKLGIVPGLGSGPGPGSGLKFRLRVEMVDPRLGFGPESRSNGSSLGPSYGPDSRSKEG